MDRRGAALAGTREIVAVAANGGYRASEAGSAAIRATRFEYVSIRVFGYGPFYDGRNGERAL
jgi:hypothetical protein